MTDIESKMKQFGMRITGPDKCCDYLSKVSKRSAGKTRPIFARFIHNHQRERVRFASFCQADDLKDVARWVGVQLPRAMRDARRPLYP